MYVYMICLIVLSFISGIIVAYIFSPYLYWIGYRKYRNRIIEWTCFQTDGLDPAEMLTAKEDKIRQAAVLIRSCKDKKDFKPLVDVMSEQITPNLPEPTEGSFVIRGMTVAGGIIIIIIILVQLYDLTWTQIRLDAGLKPVIERSKDTKDTVQEVWK